MTQILRDDPARRFTYGVTLLNYTMRLWYCDRSEVVVSSAFHIMQVGAALREMNFSVDANFPLVLGTRRADTLHPITRLSTYTF